MTLLSYTVNYIPNQNRQRKWENHFFFVFGLFDNFGLQNFVILQPLSVLNNYFSVGIDAHIALNFHRARNNNPDHFTSRTRNLLFYGIEGGKDLFKQQWRTLMDYVSIECDGEDYTQRLKAYGTHSVLFLNIKVRVYRFDTFPRHQKMEEGKAFLSL